MSSPPQVSLGYSTTGGKLCGVHIYNKNRLIKMYKRFGMQLQANCMWKTLLGVVEADCLTPSHSKQVWLLSSLRRRARRRRRCNNVEQVPKALRCAAQSEGALYGSAAYELPQECSNPQHPHRHHTTHIDATCACGHWQEFDESQQIWYKVKTHIGSTMRTYYDDIQVKTARLHSLVCCSSGRQIVSYPIEEPWFHQCFCLGGVRTRPSPCLLRRARRSPPAKTLVFTEGKHGPVHTHTPLTRWTLRSLLGVCVFVL